MVAFVLYSSDYHQSMHCSFLQFKWSQRGRIEVVPQNPSKISLRSDNIKENLKKEKLWHCSFFFGSEKKDILFFGID